MRRLSQRHVGFQLQLGQIHQIQQAGVHADPLARIDRTFGHHAGKRCTHFADVQRLAGDVHLRGLGAVGGFVDLQLVFGRFERGLRNEVLLQQILVSQQVLARQVELGAGRIELRLLRRQPRPDVAQIETQQQLAFFHRFARANVHILNRRFDFGRQLRLLPRLQGAGQRYRLAETGGFDHGEIVGQQLDDLCSGNGRLGRRLRRQRRSDGQQHQCS